MGKINQGILGGFSGKVGNVIGGNWKGIDYMRVKPASVSNPKTDGQLDQRSRFATALKFLQPIKDFIKIGYKNYAIQMTEFNSAMSYILKNALIGEYPDFAIDYENALVSRGSLSGVLNGSAVSTEANSIVFTWDDNSDEGSAKSTDKAMLLVYNESKGETVFETEGDARNAGTQTLTIPTDFSGDSVECYISFISADGLSVTNSKYVGSVSIV